MQILLLLLVLLTTGGCQDHNILRAPETTSAPLGSNASFNCTVENGELKWRIKGLDISLDDNETWQNAASMANGFYRGDIIFNSMVTMATLLVAATNNNNRTTSIACSAYGDIGYDIEVSPDVYLAVFGYPLAPGELIVSGNIAHQLNLSWSPPFTLPGEIITYYILIQDLVTGQNESINSLTDTNYINQLTETEAILCHHYLFSIFSVNDVGFSQNSSSAPPVLHPSVPGSVEIEDTAVELTGGLAIRLSLQVSAMCFPVNYTLELKSDELTTAVVCPLLVLNISNQYYTTLITTECGMRENEEYSVIVHAENKFKFTSSSDPVIIYTSDVQWASVEELTNNSILFKCGVANGSLALGCRLTVDISHSVHLIVDLYRRNDSLEISETHNIVLDWSMELPSLVASDIEMDGTLGTVRVEGNITLLTTTMTSSVYTITSTPTIKTTPDSDSRLDVTVVIVMAVVTGICILLVLTALFIILWMKRYNKSGRAVPSRPSRHVYEDVDMIANRRYMAHKLDTATDHTPSPDVSLATTHNPLKTTSGDAAVYSYATCPGPGTAGKAVVSPSTEGTDAYEVMKPSGSVKTTVLTTDNVCYSLNN